MLRSRVLIKIPTAAKETFVDDDFYKSLFENDFLVLYCHAGSYKQILEGEATAYFDGSGSTMVKSSLKRYGFEITTKDGREPIQLCLRAAIDEAYLDPYVYNPIAVRDYSNREGEIEYKTRLGAITEIEPLGGSVVRGSDYTGYRLNQGYRIVFMEAEKRFLF